MGRTFCLVVSFWGQFGRVDFDSQKLMDLNVPKGHLGGQKVVISDILEAQKVMHLNIPKGYFWDQRVDILDFLDASI